MVVYNFEVLLLFWLLSLITIILYCRCALLQSSQPEKPETPPVQRQARRNVPRACPTSIPPLFFRSSGDDLGNSVAADSTGVYLAGTASVQSNDTGADEQDDTDAFVVKYNSTGGLLWKTSWGTSEPDLGNGVAVDDGSGLVYVVGTTRGAMGADVMVPGSGGDGGEGGGGESGDSGGAGSAVNAGASDVFLTCLNAEEGVIQWTVQFGSAAADVGNRVAVGSRGGVFLVGQLGDDDDTSLAGPRAFLAKYDYLGNAQVRG